jgi:hypothetical protein
MDATQTKPVASIREATKSAAREARVGAKRRETRKPRANSGATRILSTARADQEWRLEPAAAVWAAT